MLDAWKNLGVFALLISAVRIKETGSSTSMFVRMSGVKQVPVESYPAMVLDEVPTHEANRATGQRIRIAQNHIYP
jgi:hypothetical protein